MAPTLTTQDRRALRRYLRRLSWALQDFLTTPTHRIVADLRRDTAAAADEVGMNAALADLGDPRALAERYADEHGRQGPRGARLVVRLLGLALAGAALVAGVIAVRALPRVEPYPLGGADPAFVLTPDPSGVTYVATDIGEGSAWMLTSVRNPGPFTETITGVDTIGSHVGLVPLDPHGGLTYPADGTDAVRTLTVAPGRAVAVVVQVYFPCASFSPGSGTGTDQEDLEVTMLGVTRTITVPLGATYLVRTTGGWEPPPGCTPGEPR
jgi:hypothetical protein